MTMRKILCLVFTVMILISPAHAEEDDSTPYMPTPVTPPSNNQSQNRSVRKVRTRKPAKKPAKKPAPKKVNTPAPAPKPSSLQQAIALMNQERYEAAKPFILKAIQENKNDPNAWYWYGVYHEKTGGFYQAQYFYAKAVAIDPTFEPLSRMVYYPEDPDKTPLWDPKRPARVYPVETGNNGITTVPPNSTESTNFPSAPGDPEVPRVPVYTPPEPGTTPLDGDTWSPSVYVPPTPEEVQTEGENSPVYVPPQSGGIIAENSTTYMQVMQIPTRPESRDIIIRADKPLYNPDEFTTPTTTTIQEDNIVKAPATTATTKPAAPRKTPSVPRKVVRKKPATPSRRTTTTQTRRPSSTDVRPSRPTQPNVTPTPRNEQQENIPPVQPPVRPEQQEGQTRSQNRMEYIPPVGQYAPDPGTISETPIPPVGQGSTE